MTFRSTRQQRYVMRMLRRQRNNSFVFKPKVDLDGVHFEVKPQSRSKITVCGGLDWTGTPMVKTKYALTKKTELYASLSKFNPAIGVRSGAVSIGYALNKKKSFWELG